MKKLKLLILCIILVTSCSNQEISKSQRYLASEETTKIEALYGPEFSFTNNEILQAMSGAEDSSNPTNLRNLEIWKKSIEKLCQPKKCTIKESADKHGKAYKVSFSDGWWFQISMDVGCLEVQSKPLTVEGFTNKKKILNEYIFDSAKDLGMKPHSRIGGGHINIDFKTGFNDGDHKLFRNFIVDQANHPELIWGIFGNHIGNAPPISALEPKVHQIFNEVIDEFDSSLDKVEDGTRAIQDLALKMETDVYISNPYWLMNGKTVWDPDYYQHLNFNFLKSYVEEEQQRVELRGFRPQQNVDEFLLEIDFLDKRLTYLKDLEEPLKLDIPKKYEMPLEEKKSRFTKIVQESGLDKKKYQNHFFNDLIATGSHNIPNPPAPVLNCTRALNQVLQPR